MNKDEKIEQLEAVLTQFLKPIRGVPFPLVVKTLAEQTVIPLDNSADDRSLVAALAAAAVQAGAAVKATPIRRPRPNEVGNDIEPFLMAAMLSQGFRVERPTSREGRGQQTGYPDVVCFDAKDRPTYVECKSFAAGKAHSTLRSFYLSPSKNFKVCHDARHVLVGFGMSATAIPGSRNSEYIPVSYEIVDLSELLCDVKYEFNASNRAIYAPNMVVASGSIV